LYFAVAAQTVTMGFGFAIILGAPGLLAALGFAAGIAVAAAVAMVIIMLMGFPIFILAGGVVLLVVLVLALAGVVLYLMGRGVPEEHEATDSVEVAGTPEQVFAVLTDVAAYPQWFTGVNKVERVEGRRGGSGEQLEAWRLTMGRNSFVNTTTVSEPPGAGGRGEGLLQRTIGDDNGPFSGSWTYQLEPAAGGCRVTLTERGTVSSAVPRAVMRYLVGYHTYTRRHLKALKERMGWGK
jgi:ribosome-associated toxin RatA of RatAB toxin-antitoxin module